MVARFKLLERIQITQRGAVLSTLALFFAGTVLLIFIESISHNSGLGLFQGFIAVILFGAAWFLYYIYNWAPSRYFAALASTLLVAFFLPEPFVSSYAPMAIVIPRILNFCNNFPIFGKEDRVGHFPS